ncbi:DUF4910 domain-containing protein [Paenibacillus sepulcri]|uniref:DUF4910 domain-containing protein n=2 Tax=Paenibacillus sepulcri TaxID=359917 RepID=A0ABS7C5R0_9BACL|nr:DUF4910 domain-containing protein [Paenibacillus sepulcri]
MAEINLLFDELFPLCRSITGQGLRDTLTLLSEKLPLEVFGIPTGTQVFDWVIPEEWVIRDAWLKGPNGEIIANFRTNNLHILNYSTPVNEVMPLAKLKEHLYTIPGLPDAIPYVTSYYTRRWGFCLSHKQLEQLEDGDYLAYIDSEMINGELNYAHAFLPGESKREILISTYICHPSMANNELSGPLAAAFLYNRIANWPNRRYTYRFVFVPETIGSIAYLHRFGKQMKERTHAGLVLTCLGGQKKLSYKLSRSGKNPLDRIWQQMIAHGQYEGGTRPFTPEFGSDERQYCSPGFNLPVGQMARTVYGDYPGYHNSLDTKESMTIEAIQQSIDELESLLQMNEAEGCYINQFPYGEVKLDKHDLYPDMNAPATRFLSSNEIVDSRTQLNRILMLLNYSDGKHTLLDIAERSKCNIDGLMPYVQKLVEKGLLEGPFHEKGRELG